MPAGQAPLRKAAVPVLVVVLLAALVVVSVWLVTRPGALVIQGEVAAPRVDVSARTSGRVAEIAADVGERVEAGQMLAELSNPQLVTAHAAASSGLEWRAPRRPLPARPGPR